MEYVNILSMVMDSDTKTTREFLSLVEDVPTQYFEDTNRLSDTKIIHQTTDGRYLMLYKDEDVVYLDYYWGGVGSLKSCTKKAALQFNINIKEELEFLDANSFTTEIDDIDQYIWCMEATIYNLKRDSVDFNQIISTEQYSTSYQLRKNQDNHFFLESKIHLAKVNKSNKNPQIYAMSVFNDIAPDFQRRLRGNNRLTYKEQLDELEDLSEFFNDIDDFDASDEFLI